MQEAIKFLKDLLRSSQSTQKISCVSTLSKRPSKKANSNTYLYIYYSTAFQAFLHFMLPQEGNGNSKKVKGKHIISTATYFMADMIQQLIKEFLLLNIIKVQWILKQLPSLEKFKECCFSACLLICSGRLRIFAFSHFGWVVALKHLES